MRYTKQPMRYTAIDVILWVCSQLLILWICPRMLMRYTALQMRYAALVVQQLRLHWVLTGYGSFGRILSAVCTVQQ